MSAKNPTPRARDQSSTRQCPCHGRRPFDIANVLLHFVMTAFVPCNLLTPSDARAPAAVARPASGPRMTAPVASGGGTLVSRRRVLQLMAFTAVAGGLLTPPAPPADDMKTTASGLKKKVDNQGMGSSPEHGYVACRFSSHGERSYLVSFAHAPGATFLWAHSWRTQRLILMVCHVHCIQVWFAR